MVSIIRAVELPPSPGGTVKFEGEAYGGEISAFLVNNEPGKGPLPHAGACSHCSCHHASALPNETILAFAVVPRETVGYRSGVLPSAAPRLELRPPIV